MKYFKFIKTHIFFRHLQAFNQKLIKPIAHFKDANNVTQASEELNQPLREKIKAKWTLK